jgi:thioredoxin reductase (NADPH)
MFNLTDYDVVVVGAGVAGLPAALFTGVMGLRTLVLEAEEPPKLWSYPRRDFLLEGISGAELVQRMVEKAKQSRIEIRTGEKVTHIYSEERKRVKTSKTEYSCDALILATGARWRFLGVPGEKWLARDTSYCAVCDGQHFKGCDVVVVGSRNEAAEEALTLARTARNVMLVTSSERMKAEKSLVDELKRREVRVMEGYKVEEIEHELLINSVKVRDVGTNEPSIIKAHGVFVALGVEPSALKVEGIGVETHRQGGIVVDGRQQTSVEGIFAAAVST